jgi:glycosyltransferase involved in cell wall biosynthesis
MQPTGANLQSLKLKRALVSYIIHPFQLNADDWRNIQFSNIGIARCIVRVLNELGYIVDIVDYRDKNFLPRSEYNLFIGHGGLNFKRIASRLSSDTPKIYFSAGPHWKFCNEQERTRIIAMRARRGVYYPFERLSVSEEWACCHADAIIAFGNNFVRKTYRKFKCVLNLNNAAYPDSHYDEIKKDFITARNNFVFFSGGGNVHKGLDLLLETFTRVDAHLYICQGVTADFHKVYRTELEDYPNIHLISYLPMRTKQFYEVIDKCAFLIYLSCADGSPDAVVECMHQGLIPVLSREATIDTADYGMTLDRYSIDEIVKVVQKLSKIPPEYCEEMSRKTRHAALTEYSEHSFLKNMKQAIQTITENRRPFLKKQEFQRCTDAGYRLSSGNVAKLLS